MASQQEQISVLNVMRSYQNQQIEERSSQEISTIKQYLAKTRLFMQIHDENIFEDILESTARRLQYQKYSYGQFIFHYGERGDNVYFILSGSCSVYIPKEQHDIEREVHAAEIKETEQDEKSPTKIKEFKKKKETDQEKQRQSFMFDDGKELSEIMALNEKHVTRYFHSSKKILVYQKVRVMKYQEYFGDLALGEEFKRRRASVVSNNSQEDLEVAYISLSEFKEIFSEVLERLYVVQTSLLNLLNNCSRKQVINFSFLFSQTIQVERGQFLFQEGNNFQRIYIIKRGSVSIQKKCSTSKQQLMLTLLSSKELLGHEFSIFNEEHQLQSGITNFSAISEQSRTELAFASAKEVSQFLESHPLLAAELKKKSQLRLEFYLNRIEVTEKIASSAESLQYLNEKKNFNLETENQQSVFSKFLYCIKDKNSQDDVNHFQNNFSPKDKPPGLKRQLRRQVSIEMALLDPMHQPKNSSLFNGLPNQPKRKGSRTKSLISIQPIAASENCISSIQEDKEDFSSDEDEIDKNELQMDKSCMTPSSCRSKQFHSPIQTQKTPRKSEIGSPTKKSALSSFSFNVANNNEQLSNHNLEMKEEKPSISESQSGLKGFLKLPQKPNQKLKVITSGFGFGEIRDIESSKLSIHTHEQPETKTEIHSSHDHYEGSNQGEFKLTYLHNEMESFENVKRLVTIKRQNKKQDYLPAKSSTSDQLIENIKHLKRQLSREMLSSIFNSNDSNPQSHNDSPLALRSIKPSESSPRKMNFSPLRLDNKKADSPTCIIDKKMSESHLLFNSKKLNGSSIKIEIGKVSDRIIDPSQKSCEQETLPVPLLPLQGNLSKNYLISASGNRTASTSSQTCSPSHSSIKKVQNFEFNFRSLKKIHPICISSPDSPQHPNRTLKGVQEIRLQFKNYNQERHSLQIHHSAFSNTPDQLPSISSQQRDLKNSSLNEDDLKSQDKLKQKQNFNQSIFQAIQKSQQLQKKQEEKQSQQPKQKQLQSISIINASTANASNSTMTEFPSQLRSSSKRTKLDKSIEKLDDISKVKIGGLTLYQSPLKEETSHYYSSSYARNPSLSFHNLQGTASFKKKKQTQIHLLNTESQQTNTSISFVEQVEQNKQIFSSLLSSKQFQETPIKSQLNSEESPVSKIHKFNLSASVQEFKKFQLGKRIDSLHNGKSNCKQNLFDMAAIDFAKKNSDSKDFNLKNSLISTNASTSSKSSNLHLKSKSTTQSSNLLQNMLMSCNLTKIQNRNEGHLPLKEEPVTNWLSLPSKNKKTQQIIGKTLEMSPNPQFHKFHSSIIKNNKSSNQFMKIPNTNSLNKTSSTSVIFNKF